MNVIELLFIARADGGEVRFTPEAERACPTARLIADHWRQTGRLPVGAAQPIWTEIPFDADELKPHLVEQVCRDAQSQIDYVAASTFRGMPVVVKEGDDYAALVRLARQ